MWGLGGSSGMDPLELSDKEYAALEEALMASARGRAFLRQRDRQTRIVAQDDWRALLSSMTEQVGRLQGIGGGGAAAAAVADQSPHIHIMREELKQLSNYIEQTRQEIAQLRPMDAGANRIMAATNELDAIVTATERATSDILNATERIQALVSRLPSSDITNDIDAQTIEIMTACSFQDITGQRTTKVVNTLRYIEQRVNTMIEIWGVEDTEVGAKKLGTDGLIALRPDDDRPDKHLLHGPALEAVSQANIDALFDSLDGPATPAKADANDDLNNMD
ncbi:MAG: protein phosphatase CheZ, partial [Niveispirillum sp.]|nr:protein phosphatase CheZ [Niveispirillum sp.]